MSKSGGNCVVDVAAEDGAISNARGKTGLVGGEGSHESEEFLQHQIDNAKHEMQVIYSSKSWIMTGPLRELRKALDKIRWRDPQSWNSDTQVSVETTVSHNKSQISQDRLQELSETKAELHAIHNSLSWRLTKPLRSFIRILWLCKNYVRLAVCMTRNHVHQWLYRAARSNAIPSWIKYRAIEYANKVISQIFQAQSNESNKKVMRYLGRNRQVSLYDAVYAQREIALPDIEITVVTYNSSIWISGYIRSLCAQSYPLKKITLHFVDNDSSDNTPALIEGMIQEFSHRFKAINLYQRPNLGFGAGHDFAIKKCVSDYVLVSNVDLVFEKDAIERIVSFAEADNANTASWEMRQKPFEHPKYYDPVTMEASWSSHACILIKRSAYEQVGGYENKIFMYGEDVELSYRFRDFGYSLKYVPQAVVWHHTYEHAHQVKPIQFTGSTLANAYIRLRYGTFKDVLAIPALFAALFVRGNIIPNGRKLIFRNFLKILKNTPYFLATRKRSNLSFPFRAFDYEMQRDGAFLELKPMPQDPPLVSVITRTYAGRDKWLREAVASVMNQTYQNLELVVVEDGGSSHEEFIDELKTRLSPGKSIVFSGQPKHGRSYNGNAGLSLASGEYCVFLDDDDLFFPDHIETLVSEMLSAPECSGVYSLSWEVETSAIPDGSGSHYVEQSHTTPQLFRQEFSQSVIRHHNFLPIQAVLFKSDLFNQFGGFAVEMDALEDWDLWVRYTSKKPFKFVEKTTSLFRTPHDLNERAKRHKVLHDSYPLAIKKQKEFFNSSVPSPAIAD